MRFSDIWRKILNDDQDRQETEFLPALLEVTETPPSPIGRAVLLTMIVFLLILLFWSIFGKIDEVAVANGKVIPIGKVKLVQAEDKGVVKKIFVKEGDFVKKGQILVELDPTVTAADLDRLKKQAAYYELDIARLTAEMNGTEFNPQMNENLTEKDIMTQQNLYQSRVAEYRGQKAAAQMRTDQNRAAVESAAAQMEKNKKLLLIALDKEKRLKNLVDQESVAQFDYLAARENRVNYEMNVKSLEEEIIKAKAELAESEKQLMNISAAYQKDVMASMAEARKQLYAYNEELKKAAEKKRFSRITAPCDGIVNQLSIHTVGGIVTEAQGLMLIVPLDVSMEVEAWVDNKDIGFIKLGQKAEIKVATFNFQKFGVIEGTVAEISPDALDDSQNPDLDKKYRIGLKLKQKSMLVNNKKVNLTPGMEITAEIKIKQKRIIDFFLDPFRKYQSEALRER